MSFLHPNFYSIKLLCSLLPLSFPATNLKLQQCTFIPYVPQLALQIIQLLGGTDNLIEFALLVQLCQLLSRVRVLVLNVSKCVLTLFQKCGLVMMA